MYSMNGFSNTIETIMLGEKNEFYIETLQNLKKKNGILYVLTDKSHEFSFN